MGPGDLALGGSGTKTAAGPKKDQSRLWHDVTRGLRGAGGAVSDISLIPEIFIAADSQTGK